MKLKWMEPINRKSCENQAMAQVTCRTCAKNIELQLSTSYKPDVSRIRHRLTLRVLCRVPAIGEG